MTKFGVLGLCLGLVCAGSASAGDSDAIASCLSDWGEHPFKSQGTPSYRTLSANVKVLGIGEDIRDDRQTLRRATTAPTRSGRAMRKVA